MRLNPLQKKTYLLLAVVLVLSLCLSCVAFADTGISVESQSPGINQLDVSVGIPEVRVTFNQDVSIAQGTEYQPSTFPEIAVYEMVNNSPTLKVSGSQYISNPTPGDNLSDLVIPISGPLKKNTRYYVFIPSGAVEYSQMGVPVPPVNDDFNFFFTTGDAQPQVSITASDLSMIYGQGAQALGVTTDPADAQVVYSGYDTGIVTVDADGNVTPKGHGATSITVNASKNGYRDADPVTVDVTVAKGTIANSEVTVTPASVSINVDEKQQITVQKPIGAAVSFSGGGSIASVSKIDETIGEITGLALGSTQVFVTVSMDNYNDLVKPVSVQVGAGNIPGNQVSVHPSSVSLKVGEKELLTVTKPINSTVSFASNNMAIAIVNDNGEITANAVGETDVIVTIKKTGYNNYERIVRVTVTEESTLIKGDVDLDGDVDADDATLAMFIALGLNQGTADQEWAADFNGDGKINILDVVGIVNLALQNAAQ